MLLCHFKFSFKEGKLNFRFIGTLREKEVKNIEGSLAVA